MKKLMFDSLGEAICYLLLIFLSSFLSLGIDIWEQGGSIFFLSIVSSCVLLFEYLQILSHNNSLSKSIIIECFVNFFSLIPLIVISVIKMLTVKELTYSIFDLWQLILFIPVAVIVIIELIKTMYITYKNKTKNNNNDYKYKEGLISAAAKLI